MTGMTGLRGFPILLYIFIYFYFPYEIIEKTRQPVIPVINQEVKLKWILINANL